MLKTIVCLLVLSISLFIIFYESDRNRKEHLKLILAEGYKCGEVGISPLSCPYRESSKEREFWLQGWIE